jgi:hypothetical protein
MVVYLGFFPTSRTLCRWQGAPAPAAGAGARATRPRQFLRKNSEGSVLFTSDAFSWSMPMHGSLLGMSSKVVPRYLLIKNHLNMYQLYHYAEEEDELDLVTGNT